MAWAVLGRVPHPSTRQASISPDVAQGKWQSTPNNADFGIPVIRRQQRVSVGAVNTAFALIILSGRQRHICQQQLAWPSCSSSIAKNWKVPFQIFSNLAEVKASFLPAGARRTPTAARFESHHNINQIFQKSYNISCHCLPWVKQLFTSATMTAAFSHTFFVAILYPNCPFGCLAPPSFSLST